jgi:hypothetical protein
VVAVELILQQIIAPVVLAAVVLVVSRAVRLLLELRTQAVAVVVVLVVRVSLVPQVVLVLSFCVTLLATQLQSVQV